MFFVRPFAMRGAGATPLPRGAGAAQAPAAVTLEERYGHHRSGKIPDVRRGSDGGAALDRAFRTLADSGLPVRMMREERELLQAEAVKDGVTGLLGSVEDKIDPLSVDVDSLRLVYQLGNIL